MKRFSLSVLGAAACLALTAVTASAQMPVKFGVFGGASVPLGDLSNAAGTGFHGGGLIDFSVPMIPISLRADAAYDRFGSKDVGGGTSIQTSAIRATVNGVFNITMLPMSPVKPYIIGGVGYYHLTAEGTNGGNSASVSNNKFGVNGGAGVEFSLAGFGAFVEARYHYVLNGGTKGDGSQEGVSFVPISFGIIF